MTALFNTKTPKITDPAPLPDDEALAGARRRGIAREKAKGGRESTILTAGSRETLGAS